MPSSHSLLESSLRTSQFLVLLLIASGIRTVAQQPTINASSDRARAISLLQNGDAVGASNLLRAVTKKDKNDLAAWHWLGIAFERQGKVGDARKAHEKAAKRGEVLVLEQLELTVRGLNPNLSNLKSPLELAAESANSYIKLNPRLSKSQSQEWVERRDFLRDYADYPQIGVFPIYRSKEVTTKARVVEKPEPSYTLEARQNQVTGTVVLRAIFAGDGKVRGIVPMRRLPHGLTASAIEAARRIRFVPATKNGRLVSMWMELQYNFNLF